MKQYTIWLKVIESEWDNDRQDIIKSSTIYENDICESMNEILMLNRARYLFDQCVNLILNKKVV